MNTAICPLHTKKPKFGRIFIDKFFIALGWDVNHDEQTNPYEQEVKVEPPVSAGGQRRADYAFHLAPNYRRRPLLCRSQETAR